MTAAAAAGLLMTASAALGTSNDLIPGGSWIASCGNARTDGLTLVADCKRIDGSINTARLDMRQCESPPRADNINGELRCVGSREPMFPGSWNTSCIFETMHADGSVSASCFANNTIFLRTFKPKTCNQPAVIGFQGGELVCENGVQALAREVAPAPKVATSPPATRSITPTPAATPDPPPADDDPNRPFAGEWDIVTERGDRFRLTAEQTGNAFVGAVPFGDQRLQMNGVVGAEKKLTLVWQIGNLAGTGELSLNEDGKTLQGVLQTEGGQIEGGTWTGTRPGSGPVALPLGETSSTASMPQATTQPGTAPAAADGFETATVASAVSIRDKPRAQSGSKTIGTLTAGTTVSVRCDKSWCELAEGRGWVWKDPLRFDGATSGGTTTVPKTTSASAKPATGSAATLAGDWNLVVTVLESGSTMKPFPISIVRSGNAAEVRVGSDTAIGSFSNNGRALNAISTGGGGTRLDVSLTLDDSGNRFNGSVSADGKQAYLWSGARINGGVSAGGGTVQRQLAPIVPEQQDKTRFGGVSLEQMLDGLFNRRTAD